MYTRKADFFGQLSSAASIIRRVGSSCRDARNSWNNHAGIIRPTNYVSRSPSRVVSKYMSSFRIGSKRNEQSIVEDGGQAFTEAIPKPKGEDNKEIESNAHQPTITVVTREQLTKLKRKELQMICKSFGINQGQKVREVLVLDLGNLLLNYYVKEVFSLKNGSLVNKIIDKFPEQISYLACLIRGVNREIYMKIREIYAQIHEIYKDLYGFIGIDKDLLGLIKIYRDLFRKCTRFME